MTTMDRTWPPVAGGLGTTATRGPLQRPLRGGSSVAAENPGHHRQRRRWRRRSARDSASADRKPMSGHVTNEMNGRNPAHPPPVRVKGACAAVAVAVAVDAADVV